MRGRSFARPRLLSVVFSWGLKAVSGDSGFDPLHGLSDDVLQQFDPSELQELRRITEMDRFEDVEDDGETIGLGDGGEKRAKTVATQEIMGVGPLVPSGSGSGEIPSSRPFAIDPGAFARSADADIVGHLLRLFPTHDSITTTIRVRTGDGRVLTAVRRGGDESGVAVGTDGESVGADGDGAHFFSRMGSFGGPGPMSLILRSGMLPFGIGGGTTPTRIVIRGPMLGDAFLDESMGNMIPELLHAVQAHRAIVHGGLDDDGDGTTPDDADRDSITATNDPCSSDVSRLNCDTAAHRLLCLGLNKGKLGESCRRAIEDSVPVRCAEEIRRLKCVPADMWTGATGAGGGDQKDAIEDDSLSSTDDLLDCLLAADKTDTHLTLRGTSLSEDCQQSVLATQAALDRFGHSWAHSFLYRTVLIGATVLCMAASTFVISPVGMKRSGMVRTVLGGGGSGGRSRMAGSGVWGGGGRGGGHDLRLDEGGGAGDVRDDRYDNGRREMAGYAGG